MDISEVKQIRENACNEIAKIILEFENKTGVRVDGVIINQALIDVASRERRAIKIEMPITI